MSNLPVPEGRYTAPDLGTWARHVQTVIWVGIAAALAMLIGAFGPWVKALWFSVSGTDGSNDGWLVVVAAIIGGVAFIAYARGRHLLGSVVAALAGIAGVATTIYDRDNISGADNGSEFEGIVQIGWGLNLAMVASIVLSLAAILAVIRTLKARAPRGDSTA